MSGGCDWEPSEVYVAKRRKAAKDHRCDECHGTICKGESYEYATGLWEGQWSSFRTCPDCIPIRCEIARLPGGCGGWAHGAIEINVTATPDASPPPTSPLRLFMCHQDQVLALPPGAVRLASAAHCPNAMFVLGAHALGIQAHPEFSEAFMREMSLEEGSTLPLAVREHALKTLPRRNGAHAMAGHAIGFRE
jgi:hypothetical protein